MSSLPAKLLLLLAALPLLFSCSRESPPFMWEPKTELGNREYNGGLFPVWITLKEPAKEASVRWRTGNSLIAYSKQGIDSVTNLIKADTAFLYWETPPEPFISITEIDSVKKDTVYYYRDTVFAIVDGVESLPIVIEVKNILPRIKSIAIGGVSQPGDSLLTVAAHPGDIVEVSISLEKTFNKANHAIVEMPAEIKGLREKSKSDSLWVYEWRPSEVITDSSIYIKIKDSGGYGERLYKVYLVVYTESGSVWVAAEKEIVKYTSDGAEVARITGFGSISDFTINSNNGRLFVADIDNNSINIYDTYGKELSKNALFDSPTAVAVDVVGRKLWVADATGLQRLAIINDALNSDSLSYDIGGYIEGLAIDQFDKDFVWFAIPRNDTVGYVRDFNPDPQIMPNEWNRPSMVSLDLKNGVIWVADSSRIMAIDTSGNIMAKITGFNFVSSVSAGGGGVWASDVYKGVCRFKGPFKGSELDMILTFENGMLLNDFISPISVSAFASDGSAWIVDREAGKVVRYDTLGNQIAYGTGLKLPKLGKAIQKAE